MKKLIVAIFMLTTIAVNGQDTSKVERPILPPNSGQEISREKIQVIDLPYAVKESLSGTDYVGWTVETAYEARMTDPQSPESEGIRIYIVELQKDGETKFMRFDKDGIALDDPDE